MTGLKKSSDAELLAIRLSGRSLHPTFHFWRPNGIRHAEIAKALGIQRDSASGYLNGNLNCPPKTSKRLCKTALFLSENHRVSWPLTEEESREVKEEYAR